MEKIKKFFKYLKEAFNKHPKKPKIIEVISYSNAKKILNEHSRYVFLSDPKYALTNKQEAERYSGESLIDANRYLAHAYDCDNFSFSMKGFWSDSLQSYAFGIAWSKTHAFNVMIDDKKELWVLEPQSNRWYKIPQIKNRKNYYPFELVVM